MEVLCLSTEVHGKQLSAFSALVNFQFNSSDKEILTQDQPHKVGLFSNKFN